MVKIQRHEKFKKVLDQALFRYLVEKKKEIVKIDPHGGLLIDEIIRLNHAGGKRLRPYFCYLGYCLSPEDFSNSITLKPSNSKTLIPSLLAIELLESLALIHDDIMDEADLRRGQITTYKKYGRDMAILVGDLCFSLMDELMAGASFPARQLFNQLKMEIVCGQYLDISYKLNPPAGEAVAKSYKSEEKNIFKIYQYKTALYTVVRPLQIGWLVSQSGEIRNSKSEIRNKAKKLKKLANYGENVGIAFQIKDDFLDLFGQPKIGKTVGQDIREGKATLWLAKLLNELSDPGSKEVLRSRIVKCIGNPTISKKDIDWIKKLTIQTGVKKECEDLIADLIEKGKKAIMTFSGNEEAKQKLIEIAEFVRKREY